jgi:glycosyltransferase involved in cell wall biosynthesis
MAMQVPVVSSDVAENKDIIAPGVTGYFANTSGEWVARMVELINNDMLRKRMGEAGRARVVKCYSISRTARKLMQVLSSSRSV